MNVDLLLVEGSEAKLPPLYSLLGDLGPTLLPLIGFRNGGHVGGFRGRLGVELGRVFQGDPEDTGNMCFWGG